MQKQFKKIFSIIFVGVIFISISCKEKPTRPQGDNNEVEPPYEGKIVFSSQMGGQAMNIYTMDTDGTDIKQLTFGRWNVTPRWSPDGKQIVFVSGDTLSTTAGMPMWIMNSDGTDKRAVKWNEGEKFPLYGNWPSWSPDGKRIAFSYGNGEVSTNSEIYVIDMKTKEVKQLTDNPYSDYAPDWSPDGSKIVFVSDRNFDRNTRTEAFSEIYIMDSSGSNQERITFSIAGETLYQPRWSPDGGKVAYILYSGLTVSADIYIYIIDSSKSFKLTNYKFVGIPSWSPDSKLILIPRTNSDSVGADIVNIKGEIIISLPVSIDSPDWE